MDLDVQAAIGNGRFDGSLKAGWSPLIGSGIEARADAGIGIRARENLSGLDPRREKGKAYQ
jgi:hypothetical protein